MILKKKKKEQISKNNVSKDPDDLHDFCNLHKNFG